MFGETEKKPKHYNEGRHDGDGLERISKAMKTTLRQNVTGINMQLGLVIKPVAEAAEDLCTLLYVGIQALLLLFRPIILLCICCYIVYNAAPSNFVFITVV